MNENTSQANQPVLLTEATVQEIQLELLRRTNYNALDGSWVASRLQAHRHLWEAVLFDSFCISNPGKLPFGGLIKLRDLPGNIWNVDTLYILTPDSRSAHQLAEIVEAEEWGDMVTVHYDLRDVEGALGGTGKEYAIVSIWWD